MSFGIQTPKYLMAGASHLKSNLPFKSVFGVKLYVSIWVLCVFNLYPEYKPNSLKRDISLGILLCKSVKVSNMSSANRLILYSLPPIEMPLISGSSLIAWAKGSMKSAKRAGLSGHPWRQPLSSLIDCDRWPLILILAVGFEWSDLIHWTDFSLKPKRWSVW